MKNCSVSSRFLAALIFGSVVVLVSPPTTSGIALAAITGFVSFILAKRYFYNYLSERAVRNKNDQTYSLVFTVFSTAFLFYKFVKRWLSVSEISYIPSELHTSPLLFLILIGLLAAIGTSLFFYVLFQNMIAAVKKRPLQSNMLCSKPVRDQQALDLLPIDRVFIFLCAVGAVTICSRSSPLYPFNNWDDANCFFTVGKSMFNGLVPYRDLLEQKGPLLYFLYGLAWYISNDTFLGGYVLEILAAYFYLLYSYRIILLFLREKYLVTIPVMALLTYTSWAFEQGGSAEELCLPLLSFSLWIIIQGAIEEHYTKLNLLQIGFAAACVFWIKFTVVGLYIGWFVWLVIWSFKTGQQKQIVHALTFILIGVLLATLPWLIYFGIHGSIKDWLIVYIYDNLFVYTQGNSSSHIVKSIPIIGGLLKGVSSWSSVSPILFCCCAGFFFFLLIQHRNRTAQLLILTMLSTFFFIYAGGRCYRYYCLVMAVFLAPALAMMLSIAQRKPALLCRPTALAVAVVLCFLGFFTTPNRYFMFVEKSDLAQYQFRDIIVKDDPDATILNYGFLDGGFYTVCNRIPTCKAFCGLNIPLEELSELQDHYADNGLCDYIITRTNVGANMGKEFALYECIAECDSDYSWGKQTYRLYKLTEKTDS